MMVGCNAEHAEHRAHPSHPWASPAVAVDWPEDLRARVSQLAYQGTWRRYQELALNAFAESQASGRKTTHIVAPPGSGKTLLGVEIVRRLGSPALVLAPNSAIQAQWVAAAKVFGAGADLVAADTSAPIACLTYQSLCQLDDPDTGLTEAARQWTLERAKALGQTTDEVAADARTWTGAAADRRRKEIARVVASLKREIARSDAGSGGISELLSEGAVARLEALKSTGVKTVVLDECHHLASMWGYVVLAAIRALGDVHVLGMTATPPDELTSEEARLYEELLGPVDFAVPTPAVVREGFLAPFQELAWLTQPLDSELAWLREHDMRFQELITALHEGAPGKVPTLPEWVVTRIRYRGREQDDSDVAVPWHTFEKAHPSLARAGARFLNSGGVDLPPDVPRGEGYREAPNLDDWLVLLLDYALHCLAADPAAEAGAVYQQISSALRGLGFNLTRQGIRRSASEVDRLLTRSSAKALALTDVIACELDARGEALRALVLCDTEQAATTTDTTLSGVLDPTSASAPAALAAIANDSRTAILRPLLVSGRGLRCAVDDSALLLDALRDRAGAGLSDWRTEDEHEGITKLVASGGTWEPRLWVRLATEIFSGGVTQALVGTRALLGEGWDAPCVNCLVDLSEATTTVAVTQMRGRSLRLDPGEPDKIASNCDVVCVAEGLVRGNADYDRFVRKHLHLFAPSEDGAIEAGPSHVHPALSPFAPPESETFSEINAEITKRAADHQQARERWKIGQPYEAELHDTLVVRRRGSTTVPEPAAAVAPAQRALEISQAAPFASCGFAAATALGSGLAGFDAGLVAAGLAVPASLTWSWIRLRRTRDAVAGPLPLDRVCAAVVDAYVALGEMSQGAAASLTIEPRASGYVRCVLTTATPDESRRFVEALDEVLSPVGNPRYLVSSLTTDPRARPLSLLVRTLLRRPAFQKQWVPVPHDFGRVKDRAQAFTKAWGKWLGPAELQFIPGSTIGHDLAASIDADRRDYETASRTVWT